MVIINRCPWCDAFDKPAYVRIKPHYRDWMCGSYRMGIEPVQSKDCELNCMEVEVEKLRAENEDLRETIKEMGALAGDWVTAKRPFDAERSCRRIEEIAVESMK